MSNEVTKLAYDVCVIGSGASGGMAARLAAEAGQSVLIIERGESPMGKSFDDVMAVSEPAFARDAKGTWQLTGYPWTASCVGGGTNYWGAAAFRYREVDFDASSHLGDGDMNVVWPYSLRDLEPYYDYVEGIAGVGHTDERALTNAGSFIMRNGAGIGWHPERTPLAVSPACLADAPCMDRLCPHGAKFSALTHLVVPALSAGAELLHGVVVEKLVRTIRGEIEFAAARSVSDGREYQITAGLFFLGANAIQSAAIMLRSADRFSPGGLGNENDLVGRGLSFKLSENVEGFLPGAASTSGGLPPSDGPFSSVAFFDKYLDTSIPAGLGGLIYENRHPFRIPMKAPDQVVQFECLLADQPVRENRVTLSETKAPTGLPYLNIEYRVHPRDAARLDAVATSAVDLLRDLGAKSVRRIPTGFEQGSAHLHGTLRGGSTPDEAVCGPDGRVFGINNLLVVDGGFFPFPGGVSPTITILAHSAKVTSEALSLSKRAPGAAVV